MKISKNVGLGMAVGGVVASMVCAIKIPYHFINKIEDLENTSQEYARMTEIKKELPALEKELLSCLRTSEDCENIAAQYRSLHGEQVHLQDNTAYLAIKKQIDENEDKILPYALTPALGFLMIYTAGLGAYTRRKIGEMNEMNKDIRQLKKEAGEQ